MRINNQNHSSATLPSKLKDVLFLAPLPPPTTGQSLACQALYDHLSLHKFQLHLVNMRKTSFKQGINSVWRILEIAGMLFHTLRYRGRAEKVYLTPAESVAGNLKDLMLYAALGSRISVTYIHLHGGAGMRVLLSERHPWLRYLNAWFLRRMGGVIVLGERHVPIYAKLVQPDRIHVVKNFAPDELFITDDDLQKKLTCTEPVRVLYLSNLLPGKGYLELLSAIKMLSPSIRKSFVFDFAGGFESKLDEETFLAAIRGIDGISYHGTVLGETKRKLLHQAHIFCLPTYYPYEGQPISILEAYASGCAVITTDHSGIFDIFTPGIHGLEVEKQSPASIVKALESMLNNHAMLSKFSRANVEDARSQYCQNQHLARLSESLGLN